MDLTYEHLRIAGYDVEKILSCRIQGEVNNHTQLHLEAILKENKKMKQFTGHKNTTP